jgi:hypothetical protein
MVISFEKKSKNKKGGFMQGVIYGYIEKDGSIDTVFVCTEEVHVRMDHKGQDEKDRPNPIITVVGECDSTCLRSEVFCEAIIELPKLMVAIGNYKSRRWQCSLK